MKFIGFFEYDNEDLVKMTKMRMQLMQLREKEPENFAKLVSSYTLGGDLPNLTKDFKGFVIYEADVTDQIANISLLYQTNVPSVRVKFVPIIEAAKGVELFLKMKK
jgi:hypothetical protein